MEYNLENEDLEEEQPRVGGYRALGIIFFLLAAGGLFIGLLSRASSTYFSSKLGVLDWLSTPKILQGTLFGFIWVVFENLFKGNTGTLTGIWQYLELVLAFLLVIAVIVSLVCCIVALCTKKSAKACAFTSAVLVTVTYVLFAMVTSTIGMTSGTLGLKTFDLAICLVAALCVIILAIAGCAVNKGHGAGAIFVFLFSIVAFFAMTYPGSLMSESSVMALQGVTKFGDKTYTIIGFILYYLLLINVIISVCRFAGKRGYTFDAIRFGVLFLGAVAFYVVAFIQYRDFSFVFAGTVKGTKGVNLGWLIANILLLASLLIGFIVFLVVAIRLRNKARREREDALFEEKEQQEKAEREAFAQKNNFAPTYVTNINNAAAAAPAAAPAPAPYTAAPATAPAPAGAPQQTVVYPPQQPQQPASPNMVLFQVPQAQQQPYPYYQQPIVQHVPVPVPVAVPVPQPVLQPVIQPVTQPVVQPVHTVVRQSQPTVERTSAESAETDPAAESEMSDFERRMLELVRGNATETPAETPAAETEALPAPIATPAETPVAETPAETTEESNANYVYDPFFNSLTTAEKDEFGDLFIGKKKGDFGLPTYKIGGDNTTFFKTFFVYLGKFRPYISSAVLGKVFKYING